MRGDFLVVRGLKKHFKLGTGPPVKAVDGIDFEVRRGETLGIAGESGSGKTTLARTVIRLYRPTAGDVLYEGRNVARSRESELGWLRRRVQMVFQDPLASLDPRMPAHDAVTEPLVLSGFDPRSRKDRAIELLEMVGLRRQLAGRYPHELSGGERQRVAIARALAMNPAMIIADEPVSSLDVSIRAQVLNLLQDLKERLGLTYIVISHDLSTLRHVSTTVLVMYRGTAVEVGSSEEIFSNPLHPYTESLVAAAPVPDPDAERVRPRLILPGETADRAELAAGCRVRTRCARALRRCADERPPFRDLGGGRRVACHLV